MASTYNDEHFNQLKAVIELSETDIFPKMKNALEKCIEIGKEAGAPKLERGAQAAYDSSDNMIKSFESLLEAVQAYMKYVEKANEAFA